MQLSLKYIKGQDQGHSMVPLETPMVHLGNTCLPRAFSSLLAAVSPSPPSYNMSCCSFLSLIDSLLRSISRIPDSSKFSVPANCVRKKFLQK